MPAPKVINYVTGEAVPTPTSQEKRTVVNKFWNSGVGKFISNKTSNKPLEAHGLKRTPMPKVGGTRKRNYNLRAAAFLSERSRKVQNSNMKRLTKQNRRRVSKLLNNTRRQK